VKPTAQVRFGFGRGPYLHSVILGLYFLIWMPFATVTMVRKFRRETLTGEGGQPVSTVVWILLGPATFVLAWLIYTFIFPIAGLLGCIRLEKNQ
jgi:hypothetical protein